MSDQNNNQQVPSDGGPAFPTIWNEAYNSGWKTDEGMNLRDHAAIEAMNGLISNPHFYNITTSEHGLMSRIIDPDKIAANAYAVADAMIKAKLKNDD